MAFGTLGYRPETVDVYKPLQDGLTSAVNHIKQAGDVHYKYADELGKQADRRRKLDELGVNIAKQEFMANYSSPGGSTAEEAYNAIAKDLISSGFTAEEAALSANTMTKGMITRGEIRDEERWGKDFDLKLDQFEYNKHDKDRTADWEREKHFSDQEFRSEERAKDHQAQKELEILKGEAQRQLETLKTQLDIDTTVVQSISEGIARASNASEINNRLAELTELALKDAHTQNEEQLTRQVTREEALAKAENLTRPEKSSSGGRGSSGSSGFDIFEGYSTTSQKMVQDQIRAAGSSAYNTFNEAVQFLVSEGARTQSFSFKDLHAVTQAMLGQRSDLLTWIPFVSKFTLGNITTKDLIEAATILRIHRMRGDISYAGPTEELKETSSVPAQNTGGFMPASYDPSIGFGSEAISNTATGGDLIYLDNPLISSNTNNNDTAVRKAWWNQENPTPSAPTARQVSTAPNVAGVVSNAHAGMPEQNFTTQPTPETGPVFIPKRYTTRSRTPEELAAMHDVINRESTQKFLESMRGRGIDTTGIESMLGLQIDNLSRQEVIEQTPGYWQYSRPKEPTQIRTNHVEQTRNLYDEWSNNQAQTEQPRQKTENTYSSGTTALEHQKNNLHRIVDPSRFRDSSYSAAVRDVIINSKDFSERDKQEALKTLGELELSIRNSSFSRFFLNNPTTESLGADGMAVISTAESLVGSGGKLSAEDIRDSRERGDLISRYGEGFKKDPLKFFVDTIPTSKLLQKYGPGNIGESVTDIRPLDAEILSSAINYFGNSDDPDYQNIAKYLRGLLASKQRKNSISLVISPDIPKNYLEKYMKGFEEYYKQQQKERNTIGFFEDAMR